MSRGEEIITVSPGTNLDQVLAEVPRDVTCAQEVHELWVPLDRWRLRSAMSTLGSAGLVLLLLPLLALRVFPGQGMVVLLVTLLCGLAGIGFGAARYRGFGVHMTRETLTLPIEAGLLPVRRTLALPHVRGAQLVQRTSDTPPRLRLDQETMFGTPEQHYLGAGEDPQTLRWLGRVILVASQQARGGMGQGSDTEGTARGVPEDLRRLMSRNETQ